MDDGDEREHIIFYFCFVGFFFPSFFFGNDSIHAADGRTKLERAVTGSRIVAMFRPDDGVIETIKIKQTTTTPQTQNNYFLFCCDQQSTVLSYSFLTHKNNTALLFFIRDSEKASIVEFSFYNCKQPSLTRNNNTID